MKSAPDNGLSRAGRPRSEQIAATSFNAGEGASTIPLERAQTGLTRELVRDDEVVILLLRPSPLFIPLRSLGTLMAVAIITLLLVLLAAKLPRYVGWSESSAYGLGALLALLRLGWQTLDWVNRIFVLTDRRVIRRMGVLRVSVFETALKNIQHTSVFISIRDRLFGLGTIGFATSGSDTFDAFWTTIRHPFAIHRVVQETIQRYGR